MTNHSQWTAAIEGIAAIAYTAAEMGKPDDEVRSNVVGMTQLLGLTTRDDMLAVAEAIRQIPQPPDDSAEKRERRRPIEEMLGVVSPEAQLTAQMHARELVLELANTLPG